MKHTGFSLGGFIQPAPARTLLELNTSVEKGLCQRILWCVPKPTLASFMELEKVDRGFSAAIGIINKFQSLASGEELT